MLKRVFQLSKARAVLVYTHRRGWNTCWSHSRSPWSKYYISQHYHRCFRSCNPIFTTIWRFVIACLLSGWLSPDRSSASTRGLVVSVSYPTETATPRQRHPNIKCRPRARQCCGRIVIRNHGNLRSTWKMVCSLQIFEDITRYWHSETYSSTRTFCVLNVHYIPVIHP